MRRRRTAACGAPTGRTSTASSGPAGTVTLEGVDHEFKIVELLERYVPDRAARDRVLVDNPARFFGFELGRCVLARHAAAF